jgi:4-hydroxy-4-methyl-2-oxoglutarate aldolase
MNTGAAFDLSALSTPHIADACLRLGIPVRCAPVGIVPLSPSMRCFGRVLPARHFGSVELFFEAFEHAQAGAILFIDNCGRLDEACVGDLVTLEAKQAGLGGLVIWGAHRDTSELLDIALPFFSMGAIPTAPQRLDPRPIDGLAWAHAGPWVVTPLDYAICDRDGIVFVPETRLQGIVEAALNIREYELRRAKDMRAGLSLREQLRFGEFLAARSLDPNRSFRDHVRKVREALA